MRKALNLSALPVASFYDDIERRQIELYYFFDTKELRNFYGDYDSYDNVKSLQIGRAYCH
ncbi:MAG: hypothetical protein GX166_06005 [Clostridiaceae bacterium]|nr:hypothetical protein [Clostridiaceae bacterium]